MLRRLVSYLRKTLPSGVTYSILAGSLQCKSKHAVREERYWTDLFNESEPGRKYIVVSIPWTLKALPDKLKEQYYLFMSALAGLLRTAIIAPLDTLERMLSYAMQGKDSHDWDSAYLVNDIKFKLDRMTYEFEHHGMGENDPELVRQMSKAHELLDLALKLDEDGESEQSEEAGKEGFVYIANHFKGWWT